MIAGTLTQNDMVVSKLWLAGHLLPDLKPYTRRGRPAGPEAQRLWERAGGAAAPGAKAGSGKTGGGKAGSGGGGDSGGSADLPPLIELVTSHSSIASIGTSLCGSTSMDSGPSSRASILESITAGSQVGVGAGAACDTSAFSRHRACLQAPADIVQLLMASHPPFPASSGKPAPYRHTLHVQAPADIVQLLVQPTLPSLLTRLLLLPSHLARAGARGHCSAARGVHRP